MTDYSKLKALIESIKGFDAQEEVDADLYEQAFLQFEAATNPDAVLELVAEVERLTLVNAGQFKAIDRIHCMYAKRLLDVTGEPQSVLIPDEEFVKYFEELKQLKAENEALRNLKLPSYLNLSPEMRAAGDHAESRAKEDQCSSVPVLKAVFFEAAIQAWLDDRFEAIDAAMSKQAPNSCRSEQDPKTAESPAQQGSDCGSGQA